MSVDKAQQGWTFEFSRMKREEQEARLRDAGAQHIIHIGKDCPSWREAVRVVRPGDTIRIVALVMLPMRKGVKMRSSVQIPSALTEIMARGGVLVETHTGRTSADTKKRDAMLAEALAAIRSGGRPLPRGFTSPGRPRKHFSPEQIEVARTAWFNRDYATDIIAAKYAGMSREMCKRRWGKSGRPWPKRKRK